MSLLKINDIKEEIQNKQKEYDDEIMVGIDLGTSNSVVSYYDESLKKIKIITIENSNLVPSIVAYTKNGVVVGQNAKNESNGVVLKSIKRLIGKSMEQIDTNYLGFNVGTSENNDSITVNVGDRFVSVEEVVSEILSFLKNKAKQELKKEIKKAVISVPAYFDEVQRNATKNAASIANLEVVRLINEPTAAALAYGLDKDIEGVYLVYDLGGGTFDVSILQMQRGIFKVLATNGDTHLGGDDIDNLIFNDIMDEMGFNYGDLSNGENSHLRSIAKKIKEDLSNQNEVNEMISLQSKSINFQLSRKKLEGMIANLVEKTIDICKIAIDDSKINISNIAGVILVGGATRIPIIKEIIAREFNTKILCDINPDEVVSMGAGHSAASLSGLSDDALLLDVLPLSLGIEIAGGIVEKIIHRNTLLPIAKAQEFTTSVDNQTSILIHVLQGERELVDDLRSLGKFSLRGIPKMPAGLPRIKVVFSLDADGILTVSAQEEITGINQKIELKPTWGLSFLEMREIIENSYNHSQEDIVKRLEIQSKTEAKQLISSIQKALEEDRDLLSQQEYDNINNHLNDLIQMLDIKGIKEDIDNKMKLLEDLTNNFAQIRMDKKIKNILKGEDIKELEEKI